MLYCLLFRFFLQDDSSNDSHWTKNFHAVDREDSVASTMFASSLDISESFSAVDSYQSLSTKEFPFKVSYYLY